MMDFQAFRQLVEKTRSDHPIWFGMDSDPIPSESLLLEAESKLSAKLPNEYRNFVLEYGGGYFAFSNVYSLNPGSDWNVLDVNHEYQEIRDDHILISENGSGDFYGFRVIDGVCRSEIYFYDHETGSWQETTYGNIFEYLEKFALSR